jgi:hypothetical protein
MAACVLIQWISRTCCNDTNVVLALRVPLGWPPTENAHLFHQDVGRCLRSPGRRKEVCYQYPVLFASLSRGVLDELRAHEKKAVFPNNGFGECCTPQFKRQIALSSKRDGEDGSRTESCAILPRFEGHIVARGCKARVRNVAVRRDRRESGATDQIGADLLLIAARVSIHRT